MVRRKGIGFEVKLLDFFNLGAPTKEKIQDDVVDLAHLLYEMLGGPTHYTKQPPLVKYVCAGRKRSLIATRFKTDSDLARALETYPWDE